ncbi:coth protein-domain-containing protein [Neocallimastix lanati (nom. inval.)]|nr:coth protein-domain-containing protein [Neocallimastix sp. JGI-2020a]
MLTKIIFLSLTVLQMILASTSFVEDGKRAKLFEIMDKEVPTFRVTLSDNQLELLKLSMQNNKMNISDFGAAVDTYVNMVEFEKVKNATLVVEINDKEEKFDKVSFDIGGSSARTYGRQGFNIKIRDKNKDLFGRTQFRIRSDPRDATYLRSKLCCDMLNRLGIPSISANYIKLYVNEEYFGFYILMDAPKIPWIEQVFGEKDTKSLYKCKDGGGYLSFLMGMDICENEAGEDIDRTEWVNLLKTLDNAQTAEEIEDIFDVDQFLYLAAFDYLIGSWDHFFLGGHNYSMYKNKNTGKWTMIYYDFDSDLGQDIVSIEFIDFNPPEDKNFPYRPIRQWFHLQPHIADVTIWSNPQRFERILSEIVSKVFNPATLFPHIDDLKDFIRPYVLNDKTPDENGLHPGILNLANPTDYSMEEWEANSEFTTINNPGVGSDAYGIKFWVLERYRAVCKDYNLECDPVYLDENYKYPIDKEVEGELNLRKWEGVDWRVVLGIPIEEPAGISIEEPIEEPTDEPTEEPFEEPIEEPTEEPTDEPIDEPTEEPTDEPIDEPTEEPTEEPTDEPIDEPIEETTEEVTKEPTVEPVVEPNEEVTVEPTVQLIDDPNEESNEESTEPSNIYTFVARCSKVILHPMSKDYLNIEKEEKKNMRIISKRTQWLVGMPHLVIMNGVLYMNSIFKPICVYLQEVSNSKFIFKENSSSPLPGMRSLFIGIHLSNDYMVFDIKNEIKKIKLEKEKKEEKKIERKRGNEKRKKLKAIIIAWSKNTINESFPNQIKFIDNVDDVGWTALHWACYYGYEKLIDLLLKGNADHDCKTLEGLKDDPKY